METFRCNLIKDPPWKHSSSAAAAAHAAPLQSGVAFSWEAEARLRDVAEEVYSVSERAITAYIDAVRAELLDHVEEVAQRCSDKAVAQLLSALAPLLPTAMEHILSCSDDFEEVAGAAFGTACSLSDTAKATKATADYANVAPPSTVHGSSLAACAAGTLMTCLDGGTGSCQQDAAAASLRQGLPLVEASSSAAPAAMPAAITATFRPPEPVPYRRREAPPALARRLRSPSPGQTLADSVSGPFRPPRAPSSSPCPTRAAETTC